MQPGGSVPLVEDGSRLSPSKAFVESVVEEDSGSTLLVVIGVHDEFQEASNELELDVTAERGGRLRLCASGVLLLERCIHRAVDIHKVATPFLGGNDSISRSRGRCGQALWCRRRRRLLVRVPIARQNAEPAAGTDGGILLLPSRTFGGAIFDPTHGSSQVILAWIRDTATSRGWLEDQRVLDYGCGSGVLGLYAIVCGGARSVCAVDLDWRCLAATSANAKENGLHKRVSVALPPQAGRSANFADFFGDFEDEWYTTARESTLTHGQLPSLDVEAEEGGFGCVIVNMRKNALVRNASHLVKICARGGIVVVSGFMVDFEERDVIGAFRTAGLDCDVNLDASRLQDAGDLRVREGYGLFWGRRKA
eukprot:TRINITY_DN61847_c0_g1_i1.p1 TRINITY_DN61847_c0_g1~~TRINITY_DN61847_c0_g1_i1.p1  ORF type:complete len:365 (+),score=56.93 TRINITY_DN61847_c0_g1_i1:284-1378(+)